MLMCPFQVLRCQRWTVATHTVENDKRRGTSFSQDLGALVKLDLECTSARKHVYQVSASRKGWVRTIVSTHASLDLVNG